MRGSRVQENRQIIVNKKRQLAELQSELGNLKRKNQELQLLDNFLREYEVQTLEELSSKVEEGYKLFSNLRSLLHKALQENKGLSSLGELRSHLGDVKSLKELQSEVEDLSEEIEKLLEIFDFCRVCIGKGEVIDPSLAYGDPYARSSDCRRDYHECGGTGKYRKPKN